jgi:hypothetical protein
MSIPLVQKAEKDNINTSIIAIKRNIERINMLLGLSNSEDIDTSEFVKKSDIVDEVTVGNMQPVTSNAVAKAMSYSTEEVWTGGYFIDGKKIYRKCFFRESSGGNWTNNPISSNIDNIVKIEGTAKRLDSTNGTVVNIPSTFGSQTYQISISVSVVPNGVWTFSVEGWNISNFSKIFVVINYTKTTE